MYSHAVATLVLVLNACSLVFAEPAVTPAAQLAPRAADPGFVGYISRSGSFSDPRSCDYPQTVSTSGNYVQCCPTTGACPFYTTCSANTLLGAGVTVPCDINPSLTCNTGVIVATAGGSGGPSYLACWQTSLGNSPFTFVQNIGSATPAGGSTASTSVAISGNSAQSSGASTRSQATTTQSTQTGSGTVSTGSASGAAVSSSTSRAAAGNEVAGDSGNLLRGILALLAPLLL